LGFDNRGVCVGVLGRREGETVKRARHTPHPVGVGRVAGPMNGHGALDRHCRRGLEKVTLHCLSAVLVFQADAVAKLSRDAIWEVRKCTRRVA
jgi:hypothetical protein